MGFEVESDEDNCSKGDPKNIKDYIKKSVINAYAGYLKKVCMQTESFSIINKLNQENMKVALYPPPQQHK
jgi:hypothetical protein